MNKDTAIDCDNWRYIIGEITSDLNLDDLDEEKQNLDKFILKQEVNYGIYLGVYAMIIPFPHENHLNYARIINKVQFYLKKI